jgi:hypothetical protein
VPADETTGHLLDHYGSCVLEPGCICRLPGAANSIGGWMGTDCPHWRSWGCRTWAELREKQLAIMKLRE